MLPTPRANANMTSYTKPEIHCVLNYTQREKSEPLPHVQKCVTFERVILRYVIGRTDRHTDMLIAILRTPLGRGVTK